MLGLLYADVGNISPVGQAFEGLPGTESNPGTDRKAVQFYSIPPDRLPIVGCVRGFIVLASIGRFDSLPTLSRSME
jgi:hypothetical protein